MKLFNFDWLKNPNRKTLENLQSTVTSIQNSVESALHELNKMKSKKPYKNLYFSNGDITIVFENGKIHTQSNVDKDTFLKIKETNSLEDIMILLGNTVSKELQVETKEEKELVLSNSQILNKYPEHFIVSKDEVFLKGIKIPLPAIIVSSFIEIFEKMEGKITTDEYNKYKEAFNALKMFTLWLFKNPIASSRNDLLNFVKKNDVKITKNGNLVLYRRIVSYKETNRSYTEFVSKMYVKVKSWKKSPKDYFVIEDQGKYKLSRKGDKSLHDLYKSLSEEKYNKFTSSHNKGKHTIKIGSIYKISDDEINLDNGLCAAGGLHAAAVDYNYSGFGDTPVVVLVNPSKAITVPVNETGKLRTTEMFVVCVNDKPAGVHFENDILSSLDDEYYKSSMEELEDSVKNKSFSTAAISDKVAPVTFHDLENIKKMLSNRISIV